MGYIFCIFIYVQNIYINFTYDDITSKEARAYHAKMTLLLWLFTIHPALIYFAAIYNNCKKGNTVSFLFSTHFIIDTTFIVGNIVNGWLQNTEESQFEIKCVVPMLIMTFFSMIKTITSLRVFDKFSPLVTMIENVVLQLTTFLFFYLILLGFFAIMFSVITSEAPESSEKAALSLNS